MESRQSVTVEPRCSLLNDSLPQFPSLPQDFYSPRPENNVSTHICLPASGGSQTIDALQLAWATVLAEKTSSPEVIYGVLYNGGNCDTGEAAATPFSWFVKPEHTISDELARIAVLRQGLQAQNKDNLNGHKLKSTSPKEVIGSQFHNLLVIENVDESAEFKSDSPSYNTRYALSVHCVVKGARVDLRAKFDAIVIPETKVKMLLMQFTDTLQMIYSLGPAALVKDLQQIGPDGLKMVSKWNLQTWDDHDRIDEMIERQLKNTPDLAAVSAFDGDLKYRELDAFASQLASQLIRRGVRPGTFVGIFLSKSMFAIVSMVAVIRAGGAFVFLSPSLPSLRVKVMCDKTPVDLILTIKSLFEDASEFGPPVLAIEKDETAETIPLITTAATPGDPLYAIYTSGSTGEPKGVVVNRASFGPGARRFMVTFGLHPGCRVFQSVSYAFVVSIIEQLMALASGSCICVPSEEEQQNNLEEAISRCEASSVIMTPSVARNLNPSNLASLKTLVLAGEPVTQSDVKQWSEHVRVYSLYGQSETGSSLLIEDISGSLDSYGLGSITTGACWIVHPADHTRLTPIGGEGELMIESIALATEYIKNADESAKTFIHMPEWLQQLRPQGHQARYLLTGDIVRYSDSKGTIRLVGRKGTGAKIRGQRIELGEIECHLRQQLPGAKHVIVEVVRPAGSQAILVGFATGLTEDIRASARRAIAELRRVLPSFMIPSAIVPLSKLPTTATGKIHRKALREQMAFLTLSEIRSNNQEERKPYLAPTSSNEALLQEIVEDLLNLPRSSVGLSESFFDAGGDSLTARQLVTKARSRGMTLTVAAIFEDPTLSNLAACMRQLNGVDGIAKDHDPFQTLRSDLLQTVPSFLHESIEDVYPTMGIAARTVTERRIDYFPFAFNGPVDCEQLRKACDALIQAVPVMRSVFIPFQNQHLQVTLRAIKSAYVEHTVPPDESALSWTRAIISEDRKLHHPFDQPVIGFILVRKSIEENILILRLSHAIYDGGCLQQIGKELSAAYNAESLPVATATFTDYSRTAARLRTPEALGFWSEVVAGSEITSLARVSEGQQDSSVFSAEISPSSPPPGITMATAIKAAWAWVLHTETKKLDILFGQICSTRGISLPTGSGSDVIGCCLNTTPVRVRLDTLKISGGTVHDLLNMIQRQHVQGLPYETADWSDVVAHGTAWRKGTDFDSVILHENFGDLPFLRFGDAVGQMGEPVFDSIPADQHLLTTWPVEERLSAMFITRAGLLGSKNAERLVALFGQTLTRFLDFPEEFLFSSANKIHECIGVTSVMVQES